MAIIQAATLQPLCSTEACGAGT